MPDTNRLNTGFDPLYTADSAADCTLVAGVSLCGFSFCIFDHMSKRFLAAGSEISEGHANKRKLISDIETLTSRNPELNLKHGRRILLYESCRSTLIPLPLFDEHRSELYHHFNHAPEDDEMLFTNRLKNPEAYNLFSVPEDIILVMEKNFGMMEVKHHASVLIEGLMGKFKNYPGGAVTVINVGQSSFDIVIIENQKLQLFNTFTYHTAEDFIYFVLFVFEQMKLNPETDVVLLSGNIGKNSRMYELLYRYFRNLDFIERPDTAGFSFVFDNTPGHFHYQLVQAALCE